jgi:hypothetical protein
MSPSSNRFLVREVERLRGQVIGIDTRRLR